MNFAIFGCGLIGQKRAQAIRKKHRIVVASDRIIERAQALANQHSGAECDTDWRSAAARPDVHAVVVATTNDSLVPVSIAALEAGKHVLVEKPAARNSEELRSVTDAALLSGRCVQVGFNHRYHPALRKARELFESGAIGKILFVRARYGHGGRVGYDRE